MSKRDSEYRQPKYCEDSTSSESEEICTPKNTGLSQSFSFIDVTPEVSTPTYKIAKTTQKNKWGLRKYKRAKRGLVKTPTKGKKIRTSPNLSLESIDVHYLPECSTPKKEEEAVLTQPPDSPKLTSAARKLGLTFELIEEEPQIDLTVRAEDLSEKEVKVKKVRSNLVIDSDVLQSVLDSCAVCAVCKKSTLKLWDKGTRTAFANYLTLRCEFCHRGEDFWTVSGKFHKKIDIGGKQITQRNDAVFQSILAGRLLGVSRVPLNLYHAFIGIPPAPKNISDPLRELLWVAEFVAKKSMDNAVFELKGIHGSDANNKVHDIASFDGAYQKRSGKGGGGYSRYCFGSVISMTTGKVLAYDVACNSCQLCTLYDNQRLDEEITEEEYILNITVHRATCPASYAALSSVSLESEIAVGILKSALDRGVIFDGLVCDGDNKTFGKIADQNPYAEQYPQHEVKRFECLTHVQKRMKPHIYDAQQQRLKVQRESKKRDRIVIEQTVDPEQRKQHLNKLKSVYKGTLVTKNIPRGEWKDLVPARLFASPKSPAKKSRGKSSKSGGPIELKHITLELSSRITLMYQLAVKQNLGDTEAILRSVKAIPLHLGANDQNKEINHAGCPKGVDSWCRYQKATALGEVTPQHPNYLSEEAVQLLLETFSKYNYDKPFFIEQIADASTSNHNEAIHHVLFSMARKTGAIGMDTMKLASALAVIRYNEGMRGVLSILDLLRVKIHPAIRDICNLMDRRRVKMSYGFREVQHKRFRLRMSRQKKNTASINLFGRDYEPSKYSASSMPQPLPTISTSEVDSSHDVPTSSNDLPTSSLDLSKSSYDHPATSPELPTFSFDFPSVDFSTKSSRLRRCQICLEVECYETIIDDLNMCVSSAILNWIECPSCNLSFHFHCVGLDEAADIPEYDWNCERCADKFDETTFDL